MKGIFDSDYIDCLLNCSEFYIPEGVFSIFCDEIIFKSDQNYFRIFAAVNQTNDDFDLWIWPLNHPPITQELKVMGGIILCSAKVSRRSEYSLQSQVLSEVYIENTLGGAISVIPSLERPGMIEVLAR